ncbi:hypothetical protein [Candidatus Frankia alpina]|uniref:ABM domain-containing protein n=1 Tax=Candidatus Frankia alpina TaxID=2699483 RepID=A0A4S5EBE3_9ACTN|nr:hypothetical protein [Candidatus Frankia alpina]THJ69088.1 hypothetical protein E7Y31_16470 [Candidatus Frankia alpina]
MTAMVLRSTVRSEYAPEVESAVKALFAALERHRPHGVHYASYRLADGVTYLVVLQVEDGIDNPLPAIAEFREFQENLKGWLAAPPIPEQATVLGDYRC